MKDNLSYEEILVQIFYCYVRKLRTKEVALVKVLWRNKFVVEATWEVKDHMKLNTHISLLPEKFQTKVLTLFLLLCK